MQGRKEDEKCSTFFAQDYWNNGICNYYNTLPAFILKCAIYLYKWEFYQWVTYFPTLTSLILDTACLSHLTYWIWQMVNKQSLCDSVFVSLTVSEHSKIHHLRFLISRMLWIWPYVTIYVYKWLLFDMSSTLITDLLFLHFSSLSLREEIYSSYITTE